MHRNLTLLYFVTQRKLTRGDVEDSIVEVMFAGRGHIEWETDLRLPVLVVDDRNFSRCSIECFAAFLVGKLRSCPVFNAI